MYTRKDGNLHPSQAQSLLQEGPNRFVRKLGTANTLVVNFSGPRYNITMRASQSGHIRPLQCTTDAAQWATWWVTGPTQRKEGAVTVANKSAPRSTALSNMSVLRRAWSAERLTSLDKQSVPENFGNFSSWERFEQVEQRHQPGNNGEETTTAPTKQGGKIPISTIGPKDVEEATECCTIQDRVEATGL